MLIKLTDHKLKHVSTASPGFIIGLSSIKYCGLFLPVITIRSILQLVEPFIHRHRGCFYGNSAQYAAGRLKIVSQAVTGKNHTFFCIGNP